MVFLKLRKREKKSFSVFQDLFQAFKGKFVYACVVESPLDSLVEFFNRRKIKG